METQHPLEDKSEKQKLNTETTDANLWESVLKRL